MKNIYKYGALATILVFLLITLAVVIWYFSNNFLPKSSSSSQEGPSITWTPELVCQMNHTLHGSKCYQNCQSPLYKESPIDKLKCELINKPTYYTRSFYSIHYWDSCPKNYVKTNNVEQVFCSSICPPHSISQSFHRCIFVNQYQKEKQDQS